MLSGRPLPDLCLIAVFQMMPPNDQLKASQMSLRCTRLVRAANRSMKTLIITDKDFTINPDILNNIKMQIDSYSVASKPSMHQLMDAGETSPNYYPMTIYRFSKWNCLHLDRYSKLDTASTEQIANAFSAITDLKFSKIYPDYSLISENAVSLLNHPTWKCQLTNLIVDFNNGINKMNNGRVRPLFHWTHRLISAINGLTALQQLTIDWSYYDTNILDLTILAQLKVVVFKSNYLTPFLRCLERYADDNAHLQVHLINWGNDNDLLSLSEPLCNRIVRYDNVQLQYTHDRMPLLCNHFCSLTSLFIYSITSPQVVPLFTALSQLQQLIHLSLKVYFGQDNEEAAALPPPPQAQLNSLRALDLDLAISSHSQIEWLNLSVTMPNLKTIFVGYFSCDYCKFWFNHISASLLPVSSAALDCYRASLFQLHSIGPLTQFILSLGEEGTSVEKLLQSE